MTHKRETDRERRVVRAVIEVSKTHQDLLFDIAQAAVSAPGTSRPPKCGKRCCRFTTTT